MPSLAESLEGLKSIYQNPDRPTPFIIDEQAFLELEGLARNHLLPFLQEVNDTLLNQRGRFGEKRYASRSGDNLKAGIELSWDHNGPAGKSLELGVRDGSFQQIYEITGRGISTIFTSMKDMDGADNPAWQKGVQERIVELLETHPDWLTFNG